ncbi:hypothetical protein KSS87_001197, partial [Heliosperma pusillum]
MRINNALLCVDEINDAVRILNKKLVKLVDSLNGKLAGAKFTFIDISSVQNASPFAIGWLTSLNYLSLINLHIYDNNISRCLKDTMIVRVRCPLADMTCCELRSDYQCKPNVPPCLFRDLYAFMDGFHPTEILNKLTARLSFNSAL